MQAVVRAGFVVVVLVLAGSGGSAWAEAPDQVEVEEGKTVTIMLPRQPQILGTEDPSIATVEVLPDGHALVTGKKAGTTRIVGRDNAQVPIIIGVTVVPPPPPPEPAPPPQE